MPGYVLGNFFIYSVINAFTPGPGNILALNTVTNYGYKKGRPLYWGIFAGYYVIPDICSREKGFSSMMKQMREDLVRIVHGNLNKYTSALFCGSGTVVMNVCINSLLPEGKKILIINNGTYST